jgi:two-component system sensor histidine kinase CreC
MLMLARVEQLQAPEEAVVVDLAELLRRCVERAQHGAAGTPAELPARHRQPLGVRGDPFLLQQALLNLLDNAIAFLADRGKHRNRSAMS